jgi:plasmid stabilization system protein ParE
MPKGNLHAYAVAAEENLEKLATGLAQAGADEGTVDAVEKMADVTRKIVTALGAGQERTGDQEPAEPQPEQRRETMDSATDALAREARAKAEKRRAEGNY